MGYVLSTQHAFTYLVADAVSKFHTVDLANEFAPSILGNRALFRGYPDLEKVYPSAFENTKGKEVLGIQYRSKKDTIKDLLKEAAQHGW
jgi:hypothetical protein